MPEHAYLSTKVAPVFAVACMKLVLFRQISIIDEKRRKKLMYCVLKRQRKPPAVLK